MKKLRLIACLSLFIVLTTASCKKFDEGQNYSGNIPLTPAQVVPIPSTSTASGSMTASYSTKTKTLGYTVTWSNLSGPITAMHIHGLAGTNEFAVPPPAGSFPSVGPYYGVAQNITGYPATTSGSITGSLVTEGVVITEEDLLAGKFYIDIHTAAQPAGALRGQIILQ
jgi:hypothetical protein